MIYFVQRPDGGPIKIGTSIHVAQRLKELVYDYEEELCVLAVTQGSYDEETVYHERFRHLHLLDEWFEAGDDLLNFIVAECEPWNGRTEKPNTTVPLPHPVETEHFSGRYVVVYSPEHRLWMDEYLGFLGEPELADVIREAIRDHAKARGFREPPKL